MALSATLRRLCPRLSLHREEEEEECRRVAASLACNLFTVTDAELLPVGVALYPTAALFNHSCDPGAAQVFPRSSATSCSSSSSGRGGERVVEVRTTREVQPGQEVCLAYIDTGQPRLARRRTLFQTYHFLCSCHR